MYPLKFSSFPYRTGLAARSSRAFWETPSFGAAATAPGNQIGGLQGGSGGALFWRWALGPWDQGVAVGFGFGVLGGGLRLQGLIS